MGDTKEQILLTALRLFARDGYEAVSVSDIAGELGMTKGALYRHYTGKRAIFESIVARMERRDAEYAAAHDLPEGTPQEMEDAYHGAALEQMVAFAKAMFRYWTQDEFASRFRRLLTLEQFRSAELGALYQQYLCAGPLGYMADLFAGLGIPEPRREAARFYAPMFLLYSVYDGAADKAEALSLADALLEGEGARLNEILRQIGRDKETT